MTPRRAPTRRTAALAVAAALLVTAGVVTVRVYVSRHTGWGAAARRRAASAWPDSSPTAGRVGLAVPARRQGGGGGGHGAGGGGARRAATARRRGRQRACFFFERGGGGGHVSPAPTLALPTQFGAKRTSPPPFPPRRAGGVALPLSSEASTTTAPSSSASFSSSSFSSPSSSTPCTVDVFVRTYKGDGHWFIYMLRSLARFLHPAAYRTIHVVTDAGADAEFAARAVALFPTLRARVVGQTIERWMPASPNNGSYHAQMLSKLMAGDVAAG